MLGYERNLWHPVDLHVHQDLLDPSHVLLAIGLPHEIAHGSLQTDFE